MIRIGNGSHHLVLVHGSGSGARQMSGLAEAVAGSLDCHVDAPQLEPSTSGETVISGHVQRVQALLDQQTVLIGHSMGGLVAALAATKVRVQQLILIEPMCFGVLDVVADANALLEDRDTISAFLRAVHEGREEEGVSTFIEYWGQSAWQHLPEGARDHLVTQSKLLLREAISVSSDQTPALAFASPRGGR